MEIRGFDEMNRKLDRLAQNARALDGHHTLPASEVMSPAFMRTNTSFGTFDELCAAVGIDGQESFKAFPDDAWDAHVRASTRFESWHDMQEAAAAEWAKQRLFDGL